MVSTRNADEVPAEGTIDLREFFATMVRRKWLVLGVAVVVMSQTALYSYSRTPVFTSKADVLVRPTLTNPLDSYQPDRTNLQTEMRIATSATVASVALDLLESPSTLETLMSNVSVTAPDDAQILEISYSALDARGAQLGAQAFADAYLDFKTDQAIGSISGRTSALQTEIDKLDEEINGLNAKIADLERGAVNRTNLIEERRAVETTRLALRNQLATVSTLSSDPGQVIQPAQLPLSPSHPKHRLDLLLGALIGLIIGMGLAWASERRRERIESTAWLEQILEAPVLGMIPRLPPGRRHSTRPVTVDEPKSQAAEALRTLRTNLLAVVGRPPIKSLLVTSAWPGEGKTTVAANLSAAIAQLGRDVVLISADLRSPHAHSFFGLGNEQGLGQVLTGEVTLEEALRETSIPHLRILPSGPVAEIAEPVELLQSDKMLDVIARCAENDLVIIDGSPILAVADSLVIATMVDAVLFVASSRNGRRATISQSRYLLRQVRANVVGGVLNGVDGWKRGRGGYGAPDSRRGAFFRTPVPEPSYNGHASVTPSELEEESVTPSELEEERSGQRDPGVPPPVSTPR